MDITVNGKQMDVGDALREHIQDKLIEVSEKYFNHSAYATVTLSKEGHGHGVIKAHISIQAGKNILINADDKKAEAYAAFDSACEKAAKQLRRHKRRLRDHHTRQDHTPEEEMIKAHNYVLAAGQDNDNLTDGEIDDGVATGDGPVVVAEMTTNIESMSVSDAIMRMDLSGAPVMIFRNSKNDGINVVYRREDGNVGWIDPENQIKSA